MMRVTAKPPPGISPLTRRSALTSLLFLLLVMGLLLSSEALLARGPAIAEEPATIPTPIFDPPAVSWASVRNMTSNQYSEFFSEYSRAGYMVVDIEVDEINGTQRVGAAWQRNIDGRGWYQLRNMTASKFEEEVATGRRNGFRLIDQEIYPLDGNFYHAGVWIQNVEELDWVSYHNVTGTEFGELFRRYSDQGYMMIDIETYSPTFGLRYGAVWVANSEELDWQEWRDMTSAQFSTKFEELKEQYRMIDVESYIRDGVQNYAGIWVENPSGRGWAEWRDLTAKGFGDKWLQLRDAGYRLIDYEVYPTASGWRYAGIWRQNGNRPNWEHRAAIDEVIESYAAENGVPGLSVAIYHEGVPVYLRGFGFADVDDQIIAHSRTIYRTASVAKGVAGVLGILLDDKGLVDLEADTRSYLPAMPAAHSHTVAQTSTNRSGVGHYGAHPGIEDEYDTALAAAQQLWDVPPTSPPGSAYIYSTHAYTYLGAALEVAAGAPIGTLLDTHLRTPFGLKSLKVEDRSIPHPFRATLYNQSNQEVTADNLSWKVLGGGLEASSYDLARFGVKLVNNSILDAEDIQLLWSPADGLASYGYGWDINNQFGGPVVGKAGAQNGARSYIRVYPEQELVIAVMSNRRGHDTRQLCIDIATVILQSGALAAGAGDSEHPAAVPVQEDEIEEPEEEGQDPAEVIMPVESPVATPSPEELQEDDDEAVIEEQIFNILLPLITR